MNSKNGKINGKRKHLRNLINNARVRTVNATEGDFFYIMVPVDSTHDEVDAALEQLQRLFPKNFVFVLPDNMTIKKLNDEELKRLGLMRIPEIKDDPTCPKCKSKKTMKNYSYRKYQRVCLEPECGFKGGWRDRSELEEISDKKIITDPEKNI